MGSGEEQACKFYLYPPSCGGGPLPAASLVSSPVAVVSHRRPHLPTPGGEGRVGVEHSGLVHTPQPPFPRQPRELRSFSSLSLPAGVSAAAGGGGGGRGEEESGAERRTPGCRGRPGELRRREAPAPLPHAAPPPQLRGSSSGSSSPPPLPPAAAPRWSYCPRAVSALVSSEEGGVGDGALC